MGPVPNKPKAAFPLHTEFSTKFGMELRDWFAGMALQGAVVDGYYDCPELAADYAYKIADAMMEQRKFPEPRPR